MSYIQHKTEEALEDCFETILILKKREYITVSEEEYLRLTDEGQKIAESVYARHTLLTDWLVHLGVDPKVATNDAFKMEHDIAGESYETMKKCILSVLHHYLPFDRIDVHKSFLVATIIKTTSGVQPS